MRALLLSAYAAQSHRYWQEGLQQIFIDWEWIQLELPPRHFSWRVRGNPLYWSIAERERLQADWDVVVATSMVDLATLRGLVPSLGSVPALLYFHENQFEYPVNHQQHSLLEAQMVSLYAALAATIIVFNSAYNRDTFLAGVSSLLARLPDRVPAGVVSLLAQKAQVLPVPLLPAPAGASSRKWFSSGSSAPLRLLWSARFEHDKGGENLALLLAELERAGLHYEIAITGQQFRNTPAIFSDIQTRYAHRLVHFGYIQDVADYRALQGEADVVVSTALHEFQGLAVMEAVAAGCVPVVPDRLAYRELYPREYRYSSLPGSPREEASGAAALILAMASSLPPAPDMSGFTVAGLKPRYRDTLSELQDSQSLPS